jgi:aspartyl-tRNA(Asn)/glutamyl-tRNA(Gln) amidotransferase subunit B
LISNPILADIFENVSSEISQMDGERADIAESERPTLIKLAANIILQDVRGIVEKDALTFETLKITSENLTELVVLLHQKKIGSNAVAPMLMEMQRTGGDPDAIMQNLGLSQVSDSDELTSIVELVISENMDVVEKIKAGKTAGLQFLMGHVMAKTGGRANPQVVIEMLKQRILGGRE